MNAKERLFAHCRENVNQRIIRIKEEISVSRMSANEETKSSAGNKYETGRAMAQMEVERNMVQLKEAEKLQSALQSIIPNPISDVVVPGSLVTTTQGVFYIAISLGIVKLGQQNYFVVSGDSPIGKLLMGKTVRDSFQWNGKEYVIEQIE